MQHLESNNHHLIAKARWWSNETENIKRIKYKTHEAINILFWASTPQEQLLKIFYLNISCFTNQVVEDVKWILLIKDPDYFYKNNMYLPEKKDDVIYKKENIYI